MTEQIKDIESALKKVKDQKENYGFMDRFTVDENWEVTKALEKQIPKEPTNRLCPTCGSITHTDCGDSFLDYSLEFCPNCGQALKWGNENDRED